MGYWRFYLNDIEVEEPIGWDGVEFTAKRTDSHGIDQPFSTELNFYGKGAKLIKRFYDLYFINAEITIRIVSDVKVNGQLWEFNGFLNLSIYSEKNVCDTDSWEITVGILDDNFREKFKSRMGVDIDVYGERDLDGNLIEQPSFDVTRLHTQEVYLAGYGQDTNTKYPIDVYATIYWNNDGWLLEHFAATIPAFITSSDFKGPFGTQFDPQQIMWHPTKGVLFKNNSRFARTITFNISISGQFAWDDYVANNETANIILSLMVTNGDDANGGSETQRYYGPSSAVCVVADPIQAIAYDFQWEQTVTLQPENRVLIFLQWGDGGTIKVGQTIPDGQPRSLSVWAKDCCLTITEQNSAEYASYSETLRAENFLKRLIHIITGDSDGLLSDAFSKENDGCYWNYALTNGLKIRQAKTLDGVQTNCDPSQQSDVTNFKVNFNDVFDSLNAIFCLGWAFEWNNNKWKVRIEPLEYFYQNQVNFLATNVGEVISAAMTNELVNQVSLGYDDTWKNIQAAGIWAIHTDRNYYINNRAMAEGTTKKFEMLSGIIAEGYAIEFSRRMYFFQDDSGSSDRPNDYELFIIWLNRNELIIESIENSEYAIKYESGTLTFAPGEVSMSSNRITFSGSEVTALYNINITPARNALRWWKYLGMHTYGLTNPMLQFRSGEYQIQYFSIIADSIEPCQEFVENSSVYENVDIKPTIFREEKQVYLFRPISIEFTYPQSLCDFINLGDNNPYGKVKLTSGSLTVSGYIQEMSNKPEDDNGGTTQFKLLASNIGDPIPPPPTGGPYNEAYNEAYL